MAIIKTRKEIADIFNKHLHTMNTEYQDGLSFQELSLKYGIKANTISSRFRSNNFDTRLPDHMTPSISDDETIRMYSDYKAGMSSIRLSKKYDFNPNTILSNFRRLGLKIRSNKENLRRYNINHNYFNTIDTEDKAYFLGFIYADGYVVKMESESSRVGITLAERDIEILEKFNTYTDSSYPINRYESKSGYSKGSFYVRLLITSETMFSDLVKHGVFENKTFTLKSPTTVPKHLVRHFIRGYMDGDGSVYKTKGNYGYDYHVSFVGTDDILIYIHDNLYENNLINKDLKLEKRNLDDCISYIRYGGNIQVKTILDYLYKDATIFLDRKYERYLELCNI